MDNVSCKFSEDFILASCAEFFSFLCSWIRMVYRYNIIECGKRFSTCVLLHDFRTSSCSLKPAGVLTPQAVSKLRHVQSQASFYHPKNAEVEKNFTFREGSNNGPLIENVFRNKQKFKHIRPHVMVESIWGDTSYFPPMCCITKTFTKTVVLAYLSKCQYDTHVSGPMV